MWQQVYDPFNNSVLSTIAAAIPVVTLLVLIATGAVKTHIAALIALAVAIIIAIALFTMRADLAILRECPLVPQRVVLGGFVYDVDTGRLSHEVAA